MAHVYRLQPALQNYAWGMTEVLEDLVGRPVSGAPVAEAWWGAHASAPALATAAHHQGADELGLHPGEQEPLDALIARAPETMLGPALAARWERLPYLLKVLAIAKPLSLQVHPTLEQAEAGFKDEEGRGVPVEAPTRTFKDRSHKPEMIVALTPMTLLAGFRPASAVAQDLVWLGQPCTRRWAEDLANATEPTVALGEYIQRVLRDPEAPQALEALVEVGGRSGVPESLAVASAAALEFPGDPGALVAIALNVVRLTPGQACFTGAGVIHSYQSGVGVEIMANSDNVVRAGLTPKPVDIDLLVELTDGTPTPPPVVVTETEGVVTRYPAPVDEFCLTMVERGSATFGPGPRIVLAVDGTASVHGERGSVALRRGEAAFVPYADGRLVVDAVGTAVVVEAPTFRS
ncbi:mannose-6-phosphate isomerase, class I [Demequina mangrovi]|uniref:mannose-6-phosphate isomerase n=1 Tax=Demequina mangrovi TaxID=1043493 RepID=A0A1H6Y9T7_9MICO|nr:mannose-6-phosphate isomerase, class I [Demequina mangrovi]SEJ38048.1 mannose-6-phosphate isomerase, type 1 [Demequina mangrovi]